MSPRESQLSVESRLALAEKVLGHRFSDRGLLQRALTHPSAVEERDPELYNERLEFLGDPIVGLIISEELYRRFPRMAEGGMTRIKVSLVSRSMMSRVSRELGLEDALILGESVVTAGGRGIGSALANVYEALVAALYLDAGMDAARTWVLETLGPYISEDFAHVHENPKSMLQELVQASGGTPSYRVLSQEGPPHARVFTVAVEVGGKVLGQGAGPSKKEAEAQAARAALPRFEQRP